MTRTAPRPSADLRVVVAGGGVAALEALLGLRELAGERVDVELVAPEHHFWYRPLSVTEPFDGPTVPRFELADLVHRAGGFFTPGEVVAVDAPGHRARLATGSEIEYGVFVLACGALPRPALPGALTFRGPADSEGFGALLGELEAGEVRRIAFVVPAGIVWALPLYELALLTASHARRLGLDGVEIAVVTHEESPLIIFGREATEHVRRLLDDREIALYTGRYADAIGPHGLEVVPGDPIPADRVVALPRLVGPALEGLPRDARGFVPTDPLGRVVGVDDVYAAGDATTFPVKQGGIAAQQADAVAEAVAERAGAPVEPRPPDPVLRGLLLTGGEPAYLRAELGSGHLYASRAASEALWWPPAKIVGRRLAPFLASVVGIDVGPPEEGPGVLRVEADLAELVESGRHA